MKSALALLILSFAASYSQPAFAQSPPCGEKALPYPTFAQEIRSESAGQQVTSLVVSDLRIEGDVRDREAVQTEIVKDLAPCNFLFAPRPLDEIAGAFIQIDFQRRGYYEVEVADVKVQQLDTKHGKERVLVTAHVNEGNQFRLSQITFENNSIFKESALRKEISISDDDIFNIEKIRQGVLRLTHDYGIFGFIDATVQPDFKIEQTNHTISVALRIFAGKPYTIGKVEVYGLSSAKEAKLRRLVSAPDLCNLHLIETAFLMNKSSLAPGTRFEDVVNFIRNPERSTVNVVFDFRSVPAKSN
jgi:hypothetical protein